MLINKLYLNNYFVVIIKLKGYLKPLKMEAYMDPAAFEYRANRSLESVQAMDISKSTLGTQKESGEIKELLTDINKINKFISPGSGNNFLQNISDLFNKYEKTLGDKSFIGKVSRYFIKNKLTEAVKGIVVLAVNAQKNWEQLSPRDKRNFQSMEELRSRRDSKPDKP